MTRRSFRPVLASIVAAAVLALAPAGALADTVTETETHASAQAAFEQLKLEAPRARGSAQRPPRGERPKPRRSRSSASRRAQLAQVYTGECQINDIPSYFGGTYRPYTWEEWWSGRSYIGAFTRNRYALSFGLPGQLRQCDVYLGHQYEYWYASGGHWYYWKTVNCDQWNASCRQVG